MKPTTRTLESFPRCRRCGAAGAYAPIAGAYAPPTQNLQLELELWRRCHCFDPMIHGANLEIRAPLLAHLIEQGDE